MATTSVEEEVQCPICQEILTDLVTLECGHNFCKGCIFQYIEKWEDIGEEVLCPLCQTKIKNRRFQPNWQLAGIVEKIKLLPLNPEKEDLCEKHKEKLNLFCKEDRKLVCVRCERSNEHQSHTVLLLEEAAEEYKVQFRRSLETLEKEREKRLANQADTEKESEGLLLQTKAAREKSVTMFRQLHQFLEEEENHYLAHLEEVEKETTRKRDELLAGNSRKLSSIDCLIRDIKEKGQQPPTELLKDVGSTLQRCEKWEAFENPVVFPPALKQRQLEIRICSLEDVKKQFKDSLRSQLHCLKDLDPDMAHAKHILSKDCKSVRKGEQCQDLPKNPKTSSATSAVLGHEEFFSGKYSQDVSVGTEKLSVVGDVGQSVREKGLLGVGPEGEAQFALKFSHQPIHECSPFMLQNLSSCYEGKVQFHDSGADKRNMLRRSLSCRLKSPMSDATHLLPFSDPPPILPLSRSISLTSNTPQISSMRSGAIDSTRSFPVPRHHFKRV